MSTATPQEVFRQLVGGDGERRYDDLPDLYAEQTDVRHPMSPFGDRPLLTRDDLRKHFGGAATTVAPVIEFVAQNVIVHETADHEVIVSEFEYRGTVLATGEAFTAPCIFVLRVRDGQIVESRDYVDHVTMARVRGQVEGLVAALTEPRG